MCFIGIVIWEIFPLWALNDKEHGGFAFEVRRGVYSYCAVTVLVV